MRPRQAIVAGLLAVVMVAARAGDEARAQEIPPALGHEAPPPAPPGTPGDAPAMSPVPDAPPAAVEGMIERGAYLARIGGCNDCHTPLKNGPNGPEPDVDRMLAGHPAGERMPAPPKLPPGPWVSLASATNTAFAGPWGVSYASNLTPDAETGIGSWTEAKFVETLRSGRHHGGKRAILPPMPWRNVARLTDDDVRSLFRYLTSLPPIANQVPEAELAAAAAPSAAQP